MVRDEMIYLGLGAHQLAFDLLGILVLLVCCLLAAMVLWTSATKRRTNALWTGVLCAGLAAIQTYRGLMAPEEAWPVMLAAIQESRAIERDRRLRDLQADWRHHEMQFARWYRLSASWGVCHMMWRQPGCRMPAGPYQATGVARGILDGLAEASYGNK